MQNLLNKIIEIIKHLMNVGQRKERIVKSKREKLENTIIKIFRSELFNYRILSIPFVKHPHGVT